MWRPEKGNRCRLCFQILFPDSKNYHATIVDSYQVNAPCTLAQFPKHTHTHTHEHALPYTLSEGLRNDFDVITRLCTCMELCCKHVYTYIHNEHNDIHELCIESKFVVWTSNIINSVLACTSITNVCIIQYYFVGSTDR